MKILVEGQLPSEKVFRCTCTVCKTEFEFKAGEATYQSDQRDGDYYKVTCPLQGCNTTNYVSPRAAIRQ